MKKFRQITGILLAAALTAGMVGTAFAEDAEGAAQIDKEAFDELLAASSAKAENAPVVIADTEANAETTAAIFLFINISP